MSSNDICEETNQTNSLNNQKTTTIPLVFFGRLEERKGLCTFMEAISLLQPELKHQIKIIFIGKIVPLHSAGINHLNSQQYIEQQLGSEVDYEITSNLYSQQAIQYISGLDHPIVCLTSPEENFPNTALEMGQLPVTLVVSDTGGFRETLQLVQRTSGVYWFTPKDADSLAAKLSEAMANYPQTPTVADRNALNEVNENLLAQKIDYIEKAFEQSKSLEPVQFKVTLGIICHNQGKYLVDCLSSIEAQSYQNLEVIVVDDGSLDEDSRERFDHARSLFPEYKFIQLERNKGLGWVRNHLLEISSGDYFLTLNPQVILFNFAIEKFLEAAGNSHSAIVTCAQKEIGMVERIVSYAGGTLPSLLQSNVYGGECCLFARSLLNQFKHNESKDIHTQSWEIIAAALVTGEKIVYYPYPLYEYIVSSETEIDREIHAREQYSLRQYLAQIPPSQWSPRQIYMLLTAVQQLQYFPQQLAQSQWNLQQKTQEVVQLQGFLEQKEQHLNQFQDSVQELHTQLQQAHLQHNNYNNHIQQLQSELQQAHAQNNPQLHSQLQENQTQLSQCKNEMQQLQTQLQQAQERITAMETSKFWKLRKVWFKFKQTVGLPTDDD